MRKLLPVILALIGTAAGVGAGLFLFPPKSDVQMAAPCGDADAHPQTAAPKPEEEETEPTTEFVKLSNQFVIPVVSGERVRSLVVMSLSIEVPVGQTDAVHSREPKLRDSFLQVLFDHANLGGFDGAFTRSDNLDVLRQSLREAAARTLGDSAADILITDIARQDV